MLARVPAPSFADSVGRNFVSQHKTPAWCQSGGESVSDSDQQQQPAVDTKWRATRRLVDYRRRWRPCGRSVDGFESGAAIQTGTRRRGSSELWGKSVLQGKKLLTGIKMVKGENGCGWLAGIFRAKIWFFNLCHRRTVNGWVINVLLEELKCWLQNGFRGMQRNFHRHRWRWSNCVIADAAWRICSR